MELQHGNILLRSATKADAKQLAAWWNDGAVMAHAGFPNGLGTTEDEVAKGLGEGALIIEEDGKLIGEACYRVAGKSIAEIGIKICVFDCQNRGIGKIVLSMLIRYLFDNGFGKVILDTNLENKRAQCVYESLGFRKLRVNIDAWTDQIGKLQSSVDYELVEHDFVDYTHKANNNCQEKMQIKQIDCDTDRGSITRTILESLTDWFGIPEAREEYIADSKGKTFFCAFKGGKPVGFIYLKETGRHTVELTVMGVLKEYHRLGIGRKLFDEAKKEAKHQGYSFIQVKTVQMGRYDNYDDTNRFYISLGFKELEVFPTLWDEWNPCQIYIMAI